MGLAPPIPVTWGCTPGSPNTAAGEGLWSNCTEEFTEAAGCDRPCLPQHRCGTPKLRLGHKELKAQVHELGAWGEQRQGAQSPGGLSPIPCSQVFVEHSTVQAGQVCSCPGNPA
jgi:hypothetical protein